MAIEPRDATPVTYKKLDQPTIEKEEFRNTFSPFGQYADVQYTHIERAIRTQNLLVPQVADREPETPLRGMIRYAIDPWHPLSSTAGDDGIVFFDGTDWQQLPFEVFTSLLNGIVPASGGGTVKFLRADATWATPPDTDTDTQGGKLLDTKAFTALSANIDFTSISNIYDDLLLEFLDLSHSSATGSLRLQVSVNNGSSYSAVAISGITRGSGTVTNTAVTTGALLVGATTAAAAVHYGSLRIRRYKDATSGYFNGYITRSDAGFFDDFAGWINKSAAIDAIRISVSAGAFDAGSVKLYGLKRS